MVPSSADIRSWLLDRVARDGGTGVASAAVAQFGISRQAVARHLRKLLDDGLIASEGKTKSRRYSLAVVKQYQKTHALNADFQEDVVWSQELRPLLAELSPNIQEICEYGVTEMLNNARDHSESNVVSVGLQLSALELRITVHDFGVGIFKKIKDACGLEDQRHAILELVKGRLTTDPEHHTGEGIFFTSRALDVFGILAGSLSLLHRRAVADWLVDDAEPITGTYVSMRISSTSTQQLKEVFDRYATEQDDYAFRRTHLLVSLAQTDGGTLISRSQAKRVMARCDRFRQVVLDFKNVESIGPAFADEIFRVWTRGHPNVQVLPVNMNEDVDKMIRRALAADTPQPAAVTPTE